MEAGTLIPLILSISPNPHLLLNPVIRIDPLSVGGYEVFRMDATDVLIGVHWHQGDCTDATPGLAGASR